MKFKNHQYTFTPGIATNKHNWQLVGPDGGVHFSAHVGEDGYLACGLEIHTARSGRKEHQLQDAPSQLHCWLLQEPCWHDGTSSYATEILWPLFKPELFLGKHEFIFKQLEVEYEKAFAKELP